MLRFTVDENFNLHIVSGALRRLPTATEDILLLAECSVEGEWEGQVNYLPLK